MVNKSTTDKVTTLPEGKSIIVKNIAVKNPEVKNPAIKKLEDTRRAIAEVDELRYLAASLGRKEKLAVYDKAAVDLRNIERELITKLGKEVAASVKAGGEPLEELAARLRARIEKMGRLPRRLDKISKVILDIAGVIGWK